MKRTEENKDWLKYENQAYDNGYEAVCGVDEAGRGPLAAKRKGKHFLKKSKRKPLVTVLLWLTKGLLMRLIS